MRVIIVLKGRLDSYPPTLSVIFTCHKLGYEVILLCNEIGNILNAYLSIFGIKIIKSNINITNSYFSRIKQYIQFKNFVNKHINNEYIPNNTIIWLATADTAISIGSKIYRFKFIINILELYDEFPIHRFFIKRIAKKANAIVVPEFNRANIFRVWWRLKKLPHVLENYPNYSIPEQKQFEFSDKIDSILKDIELFANNRKILIYQGHIRDIDILCQALDEMESELCLILMGYDTAYVQNLQETYPSVVRYIGFIPPPYHLKVTSSADFAILFYEPNSLNNSFCAPNKIWEYTKFGIPILCNDLAGLNNVKILKFGTICDFGNKSELIDKMSQLIRNQNIQSQNSLVYFNQYDYDSILKNILNEVHLNN